MPTLRSTLATAGIVTAGLLTTASATVAGATPDRTELRRLASEAIETVGTEQSMLGALRGRAGRPDAETDRQLREIDTSGAALLVQFDELGVTLTDDARVALGRLPRPDDGRFPPGAVYEAAIADLARIAAAPEALQPDEVATEGGPALGLLAVAAISLLALGAAALANALRHRDPDDELAAMAWSDGLTGIANRRRLDVDIAADAAGDHRTAVIMVDVDRFKTVNDTFGHQAGDDVLRRVAAILTAHVRSEDVVYRYGGEEFCILLPDISDHGVVGVAQRIVEAARTIELPDDSNLTVSVGVAHDRYNSVAEVLEAADRALFAAKSAGRDQLVDAATFDRTDVELTAG